ncbi:hypothetical protein JYK02_12570 [Corallococcus macrosporus]|uniref:Uncharacterized protein n=1 Tax=Corallococcus macrosporus TaxID=35 RepID=A0ABS3D9I6_9BACT|nr:hypothetical protein [Corallococcus macrosporus]MBN8228336.1 hypothetical protein [Corallococcus macrosporus]
MKKWTRSLVALVGSCLGLVSSTAAAQQAVLTDASGKIQIGIFHKDSEQAAQPIVTIPVGGDWVVIGGGGFTDWLGYNGYGSLLTASYPDPYFSSWTVRAKDHIYSNPAVIRGYAIGMRVSGLSRQQLLEHVKLNSVASAYSGTPSATAYVDSGYTLLGCAFQIQYSSAGNMAVDAYPSNSSSCYASGKDHQIFDVSMMFVSTIGIRTTIPGVGNIINTLQSALSTASYPPMATAKVPDGFVVTGGGADITSSGAGHLLWMNRPLVSNSWTVGSKWHAVTDTSGYVRAFAIGVKVQ